MSTTLAIAGHQLVVEDNVMPRDPSKWYPTCMAGACLPEDYGSTHGYSKLLKVISDPKERSTSTL